MRFGKAGSRQRVVTRPDGIAARLGRRKHILVVESGSVIAGMLGAALGHVCHTSHASNAQEAVTLALAGHDFDALVLELADAGEARALARQLREVPRFARIPLILVDTAAPESARLGGSTFEQWNPVAVLGEAGTTLHLTDIARRVAELLRDPE